MIRRTIYFLFGFFAGVVFFKTDFLEAFERDIADTEIIQNECVKEVFEKTKVESWNLYDEFKQNFYQ